MHGRSVTFGPKSVEKHFQQQNFFELISFLYNKVDFTASNFEAAVQLQIEAKQKMLG